MAEQRFLGAEEERELIKRSQSGDQSARDLLVQLNMHLVRWWACKFKARLGREDAQHEAVIGLLIAIDKFDCGKGVRLSTYAVAWIRALLTRTMEQAHIVRPSYHDQWLESRARRYIDSYYTQHGEKPSLEAVAEALKSTPAKIEKAMAAAQAVASVVYLDDPEIADADHPTALDPALAQVEARIDAERLIATLPPRLAETMERKVLRDDDMADIAEAMSISRSCVGVNVHTALGKLKKTVAR